MPIDIRKLIFSQTELLRQFDGYCRTTNMSIPKSPIEGFQILDGDSAGRVVSHAYAHGHADGLRVVLNYASANPGKPFHVHLTEDQVLESLIALCKDEYIPLPRRAHKYLQRHKDGLAMTIGMTDAEVHMVRHG